MNLLDHIKTILEQNESFCKDGRLFKNSVVEAALKLDPVLLKLLLDDEKGKKYFFTDVDGIIVFDKVKFQKFVSNKEFLPDSFTAYKNKIGLTANGEYLTEASEVVLDFPYKDCVLEGGQTKEDQKRKEIFWNETLAPDEIDRLLEPKALTNWKKYDKDGEHSVKAVSKGDNLIIKGNNLLALHSLLPKYKGQVKLIYIDPPYNTDNDGFNYNDSFNHSSWLTFVKNRVSVAKKLLKKEGVIFISLDDKEAHYCKVLLDKLFGRENFIADICHKARASVSNDKIISPSHNHLLLYAKNERAVFKLKDKFGIKKSLDGFKLTDEKGDYKLVPVDGPGGASKGNPHYTFLGVTGYWRFSEERMKQMYDMGLIVKTESNLQQKYYKEKAANSRQTVTTWWDDGFLTSSATSELKALMGDKVFNNPKSVNLLKRIIDLWTDNNDIVLDFFAGSGTTAQATIELNKEDLKSRKFILIEQMDYLETVTIERVKKVIKNVDSNCSFVVCELAQDNAGYIDSIQAANKSKVLIKIWDEIKDKGFISYKVSPQDIDDSIFEFSELSLDDQKKLLISLLDKNQLYVNYSDMEDADHQISKEDQALNHQFYQS